MHSRQDLLTSHVKSQIFYETPGLVDQKMAPKRWLSVLFTKEFGGFMHAIEQVGELFGKSQKEAAEMFASTVGLMAKMGNTMS